MKLISGDSIRVVQPLFPVEGEGSIPISPLQLKIIEIPLSIAKPLNRLWHSRLPIYETGFLPTHRICFGAEFKNVLFAVAIWGMPNSPSLPYKEWLELKRMAISNDAPKNTASRMIKIMVNVIRKRFPEVVNLISYQDVSVHNGTIYKASGWNIGRIHNGSSSIRYNSRLKDKDNKNKTGYSKKIRWEKQLNRINVQ